jgi:hypothetical protein
MFKDGTDSAAAGFTDPQIILWTSAYKTRFKKVFGRIKFAVNTSHFETAFTNQYYLVINTHQGDQNFWLPYPANFTGYKADFVTTITTNAKAFKFFISDRASGFAYGGKPLTLKMESKMMRDLSASDANPSPTHMNDTASLLFHELNHSIGYGHAAADPSVIQLKPNNIPYFVQIILGYNADDIVGTYCAGDQFTCSYHITWGNPTSILTTLFGKS